MFDKKVLTFLFVFFLIGFVGATQTGVTSIWTTDSTCGVSSQDVNSYSVGDSIYINGVGTSLSGSETWTITGTPGSCDPSSVVASGTISNIQGSGFCFDAYTVLEDDCGVYKVDVDGKKDNYHILIGENIEECFDVDGDGYYVGTGNCGVLDCDDSKFEINPSATEICNSLDDNCDGQIDEGDVCQNETNETIVIIPTITESPNCSEEVVVCANITGNPIDFVKISCSAGNTQVNRTFTPHGEGTYCTTASNTTLGAKDLLDVTCTIYAENSQVKAEETIETTYNCPLPFCGDALVNQANETCDSGSLNGILCEAGYEQFCSYCSNECQEVKVVGAFCGDNELNSGFEECDWGQQNGQVCNPLYGENCSYCSSSCVEIEIEGEYCGDLICNGNESYSTCSTDCEEDEEPVVRYSGFSQLIQEDCEPVWDCSSWTECEGDIKHRSCEDLNHCAISLNKPIENMGCEITLPAMVEEPQNLWPFLTGFLVLVLLGLSLLYLIK